MMPTLLNAEAESKTPRDVRGVFTALGRQWQWEGVFDARTLGHSLFEGLTASLTPCKVVED